MRYHRSASRRRSLEPSQGQPTGEPAPSMRPVGGRNPRTVRLIVIVVALVIILAGVPPYVILPRAPSCTLGSTDPLIFDQPEKPDTLDPHVTFSTPGWGIVQQVYQSLVNYNQSSYTTFVPVL